MECVGLLHVLRAEEEAEDEEELDVGDEAAVMRAPKNLLVLSPGQQQQLAFARLLYLQPTFAVLDEATSALDDATAGRMYELCIAAGITLVSVTHRPALLKYHGRVLTINNGEWTLESA